MPRYSSFSDPGVVGPRVCFPFLASDPMSLSSHPGPLRMTKGTGYSWWAKQAEPSAGPLPEGEGRVRVASAWGWNAVPFLPLPSPVPPLPCPSRWGLPVLPPTLPAFPGTLLSPGAGWLLPVLPSVCGCAPKWGSKREVRCALGSLALPLLPPAS